ncbi:hypothetical protein BDZ89DRAFT_1142714 [Hymenopellis radicata]|nr:hypothetical protein BDZ89DRAFT_1142714 [Hymenopellis radicata]
MADDKGSSPVSPSIEHHSLFAHAPARWTCPIYLDGKLDVKTSLDSHTPSLSTPATIAPSFFSNHQAWENTPTANGRSTLTVRTSSTASRNNPGAAANNML